MNPQPYIMYNISLDSPQVALQNELNSVKIGRVVVEKINFYGSIFPLNFEKFIAP